MTNPPPQEKRTTKKPVDAQRRPAAAPSDGVDEAQLRRLLDAMTAMRDGNFRKRMTVRE